MFVLMPETIVPVEPNPTVESTVITEEPAETLLIDLVLGETLNVPSIKSTSLNPTNNPIL